MEATDHTFSLRIDLGNDAMQTPEDIADALHALSDRIRGGRAADEGSILDVNGNTVGSYELNR